METILLFIATIVFLIVIHEFGHFIFAKLFGVKVEEFGIGYPPKALTLFKLGETKYTLNWIPFGGFVRLLGEEQADEVVKEEDKGRRFADKPAWQKIIILVAGALFNFLFAWGALAYVYHSGAPLFWDKEYVENADLVINDVLENSPAKHAGLESGDIIKQIYIKEGDEEKEPTLLSPAFVSKFISQSRGETIYIKYIDKSDMQEKLLDIKAAQGVAEQDPSVLAIGVKLTLVSHIKYSWLEAIYKSFVQSVLYGRDIILAVYKLIKDSLSFKANLEHIAGPVGIATIVSDAASVSFEYFLYFVAIISINLAVINLLPIPALDGGKAFLEFVQTIVRRKVSAGFENAVNTIGFVLLIALMIAVTYNDIVKLLS